MRTHPHRVTHPLIAAVAVSLLVAGCSSAVPPASVGANAPSTPSPVGTQTSATTPTIAAIPTATTGNASDADAQARTMATDSCQTWKLAEQQTAADSWPTVHQAARSATSARGLDSKWANLAQDMTRTADLPPTGNTPVAVAQARTDLTYIQQSCASLGVTVDNN